MKCCSSCTRWKTAGQFYVDRRPGRSKDGRHHACIDCERTASRERARARHVPKTPMAQPRDLAGRFQKAA
jgi:predicted short-subunit dehydrogenase-like oxidoreductase (DUF2520 family)